MLAARGTSGLVVGLCTLAVVACGRAPSSDGLEVYDANLFTAHGATIGPLVANDESKTLVLCEKWEDYDYLKIEYHHTRVEAITKTRLTAYSCEPLYGETEQALFLTAEAEAKVFAAALTFLVDQCNDARYFGTCDDEPFREDLKAVFATDEAAKRTHGGSEWIENLAEALRHGFSTVAKGK